MRHRWSAPSAAPVRLANLTPGLATPTRASSSSPADTRLHPRDDGCGKIPLVSLGWWHHLQRQPRHFGPQPQPPRFTLHGSNLTFTICVEDLYLWATKGGVSLDGNSGGQGPRLRRVLGGGVAIGVGIAFGAGLAISISDGGRQDSCSIEPVGHFASSVADDRVAAVVHH